MQNTEALVSRRRMLKWLGAGLAVGGAQTLLVACSPSAPTASAPTSVPSEAPKSVASSGPSTAASPASAAPGAAAAGNSAPVGAADSQLVVAVNAWATETPFAWKTVLAEKTLWDLMGEPLIFREPGTFNPVPGLATSWDHSADFTQWTFKLRQNVMWHGTWGEFTADDVKFTVEQNLRPDATGGDSAFFKQQLASVDASDKYTVVMKFKSPVWEVPSHFSQATGFQNMACMKYIQSVGEDQAAQEPIGTGPYQHVQGQQGQFHTFKAVANHWRLQVAAVAHRHGWPVPSYETVHPVIQRLPSALVTLAHDGATVYADRFGLLYRREASRPNEIWQADHTRTTA